MYAHRTGSGQLTPCQSNYRYVSTCNCRDIAARSTTLSRRRCRCPTSDVIDRYVVVFVTRPCYTWRQAARVDSDVTVLLAATDRGWMERAGAREEGRACSRGWSAGLASRSAGEQHASAHDAASETLAVNFGPVLSVLSLVCIVTHIKSEHVGLRQACSEKLHIIGCWYIL